MPPYNALARARVLQAKLNIERRQRRNSAGKLAATNLKAASAISHLSKPLCLYWRKKLNDPLYHSGSHGGNRRMNYTEEDLLKIKSLLWLHTKEYPSFPLHSRIKFLREHGFKVSTHYIRSVYISWRWTFKKPEKKHIQKYTQENLKYYKIYIEEITYIPWHKVHFLDEASFVSRNLHSNKAVAPAGKKVFTFHGEASLAESYSVTLATFLRDDNYVVGNMVDDTNSQYDFAEYIIYLLSNDHFEEGDYLILDNAAIHAGTNTFLQIHTLCAAKKVQIKFLPTYSPELNPVELCWAQTKRYIKETRRLETGPRKPIWQLIIEGIARISLQNIENYYTKCIDHF